LPVIALAILCPGFSPAADLRVCNSVAVLLGDSDVARGAVACRRSLTVVANLDATYFPGKSDVLNPYDHKRRK
jgi:hypothetical protein